MSDEIASLSGLLIHWPSGVVGPGQIDNATPGLVAKKGNGYRNNKNWEEYVYTSTKALRGEDKLGVKGPYNYLVVARRSGGRVLILSSNRSIVETLFENELSRSFMPHLRRVSISVDPLVKALVNKPDDYAITYTHARVPAFGAMLRSMSFYGDNLAAADPVRDNIDILNFFTCGLRLAKRSGEVVRVSADGSLFFKTGGEDCLVQVEIALKYLRDRGYLKSD